MCVYHTLTACIYLDTMYFAIQSDCFVKICVIIVATISPFTTGYVLFNMYGELMDTFPWKKAGTDLLLLVFKII